MFRIIVALLFILMSCEKSHSHKHANEIPPNALRIEFSQADDIYISDTIRLGRARKGEILTGSFVVKSNAKQPIVITDVITGCGCTTAQWEPEPMKQGDEKLINFQFDTNGRQGYQLKGIEVVSSEHTVARVLLEAEIIN